MNIDITWNDIDLAVVIALLSVGIGFSVFWFHSNSAGTRSFFFKHFDGDNRWIFYVAWQKFSGFILLGVLPLLATITFTDYSINTIAWREFDAWEIFKWLVPMTALILALTFFSARSRENQGTYPQMRVTRWKPGLIIINSMSWFLYLLGYEMLFRGVLFIPCVDRFGFWAAVCINLTLYAITHIPKGARETFGTFLYGLVACIATAITGNIVVAVLTHVTMALANDYFSVLHSSEMKFVFQPHKEQDQYNSL
jgi:membrane protease YdiL (CAAX protease family)